MILYFYRIFFKLRFLCKKYISVNEHLLNIIISFYICFLKDNYALENTGELKTDICLY